MASFSLKHINTYSNYSGNKVAYGIVDTSDQFVAFTNAVQAQSPTPSDILRIRHIPTNTQYQSPQHSSEIILLKFHPAHKFPIFLIHH